MMRWISLLLLLLPLAVAPAARNDKPVSLVIDDAPVAQVLQALAEMNHKNLVVAPDVSGTLSLRLQKVPWSQVLKQENGEVLAIDKQEIETLVEVRSGETLALGGIFSQKNKTARDSVPLLGDIPVLGRLFRRDGKDNERRELVVFITPRILAVR
ncbi:hypothetical protein ACTPL7_002695 [Klebsiella pneumoniae]